MRVLRVWLRVRRGRRRGAVLEDGARARDVDVRQHDELCARLERVAPAALVVDKLGVEAGDARARVSRMRIVCMHARGGHGRACHAHTLVWKSAMPFMGAGVAHTTDASSTAWLIAHWSLACREGERRREKVKDRGIRWEKVDRPLVERWWEKAR